jgi:hypothetical protein
MRKLAVSLAATAGCLLLVEGLLSLVWATSLRALLAPRRIEEAPPYQPTDEDRAAAAARSEGPFRVPDDALVAYTLKTKSTLTYTEGKVSMRLVTDELGLRARPGAPPAADALRILVLGDSVAFGFGLDDADTLAAQLEKLLTAPLGGRVACYTVAVPSWNARNAWRFLLDHLASLRPDIVLYLPVDNDLEDSYGVTEAGQRRAAEDPASAQPLLHVRPVRALVTLRSRELRAAGDDPEQRLGPGVIGARLSTLSRERYADMARTIQAGVQRLERVHARCALVAYEQSEFHRELRAELLRAGAAPVEIPLLNELLRDDTLEIDPHPSAATVTAFARWIAASLFELGWLPGGGRASLPEVEERYAGRRARSLGAEEAEDWSRARHARLEAELQARISTETLQGILQVYGGLNLDGTLEAQCAVVLPRGRTLGVRLAPLAAPPDLYPLEVRVFANERALGSLSVRAGEECTARFELGPEEAAAPFEVRLEAHDWALVTVRGKTWLAAARLVELESLP